MSWPILRPLPNRFLKRLRKPRSPSGQLVFYPRFESGTCEIQSNATTANFCRPTDFYPQPLPLGLAELAYKHLNRPERLSLTSLPSRARVWLCMIGFERCLWGRPILTASDGLGSWLFRVAALITDAKRAVNGCMLVILHAWASVYRRPRPQALRCMACLLGKPCKRTFSVYLQRILHGIARTLSDWLRAALHGDGRRFPMKAGSFVVATAPTKPLRFTIPIQWIYEGIFFRS
jgi:hypothetical protein